MVSVGGVYLAVGGALDISNRYTVTSAILSASWKGINYFQTFHVFGFFLYYSINAKKVKKGISTKWLHLARTAGLSCSPELNDLAAGSTTILLLLIKQRFYKCVYVCMCMFVHRRGRPTPLTPAPLNTSLNLVRMSK